MSWGIRRLAAGLSLVCAVFVGGKVVAQSASYSLTLASAGCSQAKCTQGLTNQSNHAPPLPPSSSSVGISVMHYAQSGGSLFGLGCSSNTTIVACSYTGSGNNVRLFQGNASGTSIALNSPFADSASKSAPIVFADGGVLAVDQFYMGYTPPSHNAWWYTDMHDVLVSSFSEAPISPAIIRSHYAVIGTSCQSGDAHCGMAVFNIPTGASLSSTVTTNQYNTGFISETDADPMQYSSNQYSTSNSPGVDTVHNRVYFVTAQVTSGGSSAADPGDLMAYDIDSSGYITDQDDVFQFPGTSGSSPVVVPNVSVTESVGTVTGTAVYFDGTTRWGSGGSPNCLNASASGSNSAGCFYGILDTANYTNPGGTLSYYVLFAKSYPNTIFEAGAALDPRGGIWIFPAAAGSIPNNAGTANVFYCDNLNNNGTNQLTPNCLLRLDPLTGDKIQGPIEMTAALGQTPYDGTGTQAKTYYQPSSALAVSQAVVSGTTHTYLTLGVAHITPNTVPVGSATTIDVTTASQYSNDQPTLVWQTPDFSTGYGPTFGQFAFTTYTTGIGPSMTSHSAVFFTGEFFGPEIVSY